MSFCTAINCMDGRVQLPVSAYLKKRFNVKFVDMITEAGPNKILGKQTSYSLIESVFDRLRISVEDHYSVGIAIVGHHDCAGNPAEKEEQRPHTVAAAKYIGKRFTRWKNIPIIGLWVDETWSVSEIEIEG
ncbi:MAG: carbonic anhydrase [Thermodesulfobacteriota bacterium]|nr:carbonic anhydrase [Thermodesulfobacteriota bacterium]